MSKKNWKCENPLCDPEIRKKCTDEITDEHHMFPQTQQNRRQYGSLLDEKFNKIRISNRCHLWKSIPTYNELEFRQAGEAAGFRMPTPSKSFQFRGL
ncbi:MAG: hypothetical protein M0P71_17610 [Melioribacteraceae bacterium]|jgi:hypothetical protein|nr:hypothetical protein [Melioribacteraceae bacterium]